MADAKKALPDEVVELVNLLLVVMRQSSLLSLLALDKDGFNLKSGRWRGYHLNNPAASISE